MATPPREATLPTSCTLPRNSGVKWRWFVWKKNIAELAVGVACHRKTNTEGRRISFCAKACGGRGGICEAGKN